MDGKMNLNCPQFVDFTSSEFLCDEFASISMNSEWTPTMKTKVMPSKEEKVACERKLDPQPNKEYSDDKENEHHKQVNGKHSAKPLAAIVPIKRKLTELSKPMVREVTNLKRGFEVPSSSKPKIFPRFKPPILSLKSPQLPPVKRPRLGSVLSDQQKLPNRLLYNKTPLLRSKIPQDAKPCIPKNVNLKNNVKSSEMKENKSEKSNFNVNKVAVKVPISQGCKVKTDLKSQKPPLQPTKREPFRFGINSCPQKGIGENCHVFKARPATVLKHKPFVPKPTPKLETEFQEFKLHTQQRAAERSRKQLKAEIERQGRERVNFLDQVKKDRAEILRKRREIFERYNIKKKPVENKPTSAADDKNKKI